jgi:selenocysteine-specific elongation factor
LRLAEPLAVVPGERFVARANLGVAGQSGLVTIGGGRILGTSNVRLRRRRQWTLEALAARRDALDSPAAWCDLMLREAREPLSLRQLEQKCLLRREELDVWLGQLERAGSLVRLADGLLTHRQIVDQVAGQMLGIVQAFHAANPVRAGLEAPELFARVRANPALCARAAEWLIQSGKLERAGSVLARAGWSARVSDRDAQLCEDLVRVLRLAKWSPPSPGELAVTLKEPLERVEKMLRLLTDRAQLVRIEQDLILHPEALEAARQAALSLFARKPVFSTMEFRDALGVSRKYAVPILDYFDRIRFTVRTGHDRRPGVEARRAMHKAG